MKVLVKGENIKTNLCAKFSPCSDNNFGACPSGSYLPECGMGYCVPQMCGNAKEMPMGNKNRR